MTQETHTRAREQAIALGQTMARLPLLLHDYDMREDWRIVKQWVEQCYAEGTVASLEIRTYETRDRHGVMTSISTVVAYDAEGNDVPYDLSRPFFQIPTLRKELSPFLPTLDDPIFDTEGPPDQGELWDLIYTAACYGNDWVCPCCDLPREAKTYSLAGGEPPFPWQIQIQRTDGRDGENPPSPF